MNFAEWLMIEKQYSLRSSHDATSRLKRIQKLLDCKNLQENTISILETNLEFQKLSKYVKSQLRRTLKLYFDYLSSIE